MKHELYKELTKPEFKRGRDYYTDDLGGEMSIVHESICGWWKPRFLLDNKTQEAFEFLDMNEHFVKFSEDDVEWNTLRDVPGDAWGHAKTGNATYPTHVGKFENGIAKVWWQINPDGRYFMDEDGYGMTDDEEIELVGAIDRTGKVVVKYTIRK